MPKLPPPAPGDVVICGIPPRKSMVGEADLTALPAVVVCICKPAYRDSGNRPDDVFVVVHIFGDVASQTGAFQRKYVAGPREGAYCWPRP